MSTKACSGTVAAPRLDEGLDGTRPAATRRERSSRPRVAERPRRRVRTSKASTDTGERGRRATGPRSSVSSARVGGNGAWRWVWRSDRRALALVRSRLGRSGGRSARGTRRSDGSRATPETVRAASRASVPLPGRAQTRRWEGPHAAPRACVSSATRESARWTVWHDGWRCAGPPGVGGRGHHCLQAGLPGYSPLTLGFAACAVRAPTQRRAMITRLRRPWHLRPPARAAPRVAQSLEQPSAPRPGRRA